MTEREHYLKLMQWAANRIAADIQAELPNGVVTFNWNEILLPRHENPDD